MKIPLVLLTNKLISFFSNDFIYIKLSLSKIYLNKILFPYNSLILKVLLDIGSNVIISSKYIVILLKHFSKHSKLISKDFEL